MLLCAFLVCGACTDSNEAQLSGQKDKSYNDSAETLVNSSSDNDNPPLLTLSELLNASDVRNALSSAAAKNDDALLIEWQNKLLKAADEVNLSSSEKKRLEGELGLKYLAFQGMKFNYQTAFQRAFVSFESVDEVYSAYPAFKNLHERSSRLVEQRDALIASVADELSEQGFDGDVHEEAKRQWQVYIKSQPPFTP